jgi:SAM-dependent methyltransferase
MKVSVFTPMHTYKDEFFYKAYNSLKHQDVHEWVILLNGKAKKDGTKQKLESLEDPWIKVYNTTVTNNIGFLKGMCCELATGDILLELDYDDYLSEDAVSEVQKVFIKDPEIHFVYSNDISFDSNGKSHLFAEGCGWTFTDHGNGSREYHSFEPKPQYWRRIEWAPNHLKAFRKESYKIMGGYNTKLEVGDDHDLVCRFFIAFGEKGMHLIEKPLYYQRIHEGNTHGSSNRLNDIQKQVDINYINHFENMMKKWCNDAGYSMLDLGGRFNCPEGYTSVDLLDGDIIMDLEQDWTQIPDNSVGILRAYHLLEHLEDPIHFFNEAYRVLVPGGLLAIEVPSSNGMGAFADPTHKKFYNQLSFSYYTDEFHAKYIRPQYKGRFQMSRIVEYWWQYPKIPIVSVQMICLKGWYSDRHAGYANI